MTELITLIDKVLPITIGKTDLTYSESQNMITTRGYTSAAGNTYFRGIRLSERIFIILDIGIGYAHTFLNGIKIYSNQGNEKKLIASKPYHTVYYNDTKVKTDAKELIKAELRAEILKDGLSVDEEWLNDFVEILIEDTFKNQIENLKTIQLNKLLTQ